MSVTIMSGGWHKMFMHLKTVVLFAAWLGLTGSALLAQRGTAGHAMAPGVPPRVTTPARPAAATASPNRTLATRAPLPASYTGLMTPGLWSYSSNSGALRSNRNDGNRNNGNRNVHGNFGVGYAAFYGTPYLPYLDTGSYFGYPSYSQQAEAIDVQGNAQLQDSIAQQMDQMGSEIRQLRESQFQSGPMMQPGPWAPPPSSKPTAVVEPQPPQAPIILILQNGTKVSVNSYAVMDGVIWDFSKQLARKYPASSVNLAASEKATQEAGGEFPRVDLNPTPSVR